MAEPATIAIPNDVIQPIVQARIQAAIIEALVPHKNLVADAVTAALGVKVDSDGKVNNYPSYNTYTLLQHLAHKAVADAAKEALKEYLEQSKDGIKARVKKELEKKSSILATALVDGFEKSIATTYGFSLTVNLKSPDR
jgi:hypothetical protein